MGKSVEKKTRPKKSKAPYHDQTIEDAFEFAFEDITPEWAQDLLDMHNAGNRQIRGTNIRVLSRMLDADLWDPYNGDSIRITPSGRIVDGQHRLMAVVQTGVAVRALVVYNVPDKAFETVDRGGKRNNRDALHIMGISCPQSLAAAMTWVSIWSQGKSLWSSGGIRSPEPSELNGLLEEYPHVKDSTRFATKNVRKLVGDGVATFAHFIMARKHRHDADVFFEGLEDGAELSKNHPILVVREKLRDFKEDRTSYIPSSFRLALLIYAWNAMREGRTVKSFRMPPVGKNRKGGGTMKFPMPV